MKSLGRPAPGVDVKHSIWRLCAAAGVAITFPVIAEVPAGVVQSLDETSAATDTSTPAVAPVVNDEATKLGEVVVTGIRQKATVAKQNVEIRDLPQSITLISKDQLDEAAARRYEDISYQTVGLTPYIPFANANSSGGFSRGFAANLLLDGAPQGFAGLTSGLAIVDRVEVLRGPTSVLYGQGDPGGSVNLVLKRPLDQFGASASSTFDTLGTRLLEADVTGPVIARRLDFRLVAQGEYSDTFRDFEKNNRWSVAPMLRAQPWAGATLDLLGSFDRYDYTPIRDFPAYLLPLATFKQVPLERNFGEPGAPLSRLDTRLGQIAFEQKLGEQWSAGLRVLDYVSKNRRYVEIRLDDVAGPDGLYPRRYLTTVDPDRNASRSRNNNLHLAGDVSLLGSTHKLLFAVESLRQQFGYNDVAAPYIPIDFDNPQYQSPFVPPDDLQPTDIGGQEIKTKAAYANDLIGFGKHWKLQLGLRYDSIDSTGYGDVSRDTITDHKLSPSAGLVWQPTDSSALYASYSTSFVPQVGRDRDGAALKPEQNRAYELGIKQELFRRRLAITAAVFEIEKKNILQTDPTDPDFVINGGTAKSTGFELMLEGQPPVRGLIVRGGVAYADARITESNDFPVGTKLVGPRPLTALANARQALDRFGLRGAWVSGSVFYGGRMQYAAPSNGEKIPDFTRVDLAIGQRFGAFEVQFNAKNLFNERIFITNGGGLILFDNPRAYGLTLRYEYGAL